MITSGDVSAIVVNWNLPDETVGAVHSLQGQIRSCHIYVVDNGSDDGSISIISDRCPGVEIISLAENRGFATACNIAITQALADERCEFILLLNNDARAHPNALHEMLQVLESLPQGGIIGPKIYFAENRRKIWYAGARRRRMVLAAADIGRGQDDTGQFAEIRDVDYVFGAAMLVHRQVFESVGLFDESYFIYLEDLDFCFRAQQAGIPLIFAPKSLVWHIGSASTAKDPALRHYHMVKGTIIFLRKHASALTILPIILFWSLVFARAIFLEFLNGNLQAIRSYWSGAISGLATEIRRT